MGHCRAGTQILEEETQLAADGTSRECKTGTMELGLRPPKRDCMLVVLGMSKKLEVGTIAAARVKCQGLGIIDGKSEGAILYSFCLQHCNLPLSPPIGRAEQGQQAKEKC